MKSKLLKNKRNSILRFTCFWVLIGISTFSLYAAKDFEGEITYQITYEDGIQKQILEVLPKHSTLLIKNQKFYSYTNSPMGNQGLIYDDKKKVSYTLIDMFSSALAIKKNKYDILKDRDLFKIQRIQHTDESKQILGYSCKMVIVSAYIPKLKKNVEFKAYYTPSLGNLDWINQADPIYHNVRGTLLEYEIQLGSVFMTFKATKVIELELSDSDLNIPKTHTIVSANEAGHLLKNQ